MFEELQLDQAGQELANVADYLEQYGKCQGVRHLPDGRCCVMGAHSLLRYGWAEKDNTDDEAMMRFAKALPPTKWDKVELSEHLKPSSYAFWKISEFNDANPADVVIAILRKVAYDPKFSVKE